MKFYHRTHELTLLSQIEQRAVSDAQMTVIVGRRRIGKTTLLKQAFASERTLYFFASRKSEPLLCEEFTYEVQTKLGITLGSFHSFAALFNVLLEQSQSRAFTLIIDEFQELYSVNPSIFSEIQNLWDSRKEQSHLNLILCGSIYSMMKRILENAKEPLFGRATAKMTIKPFSIQTLKEILNQAVTHNTNALLLESPSLRTISPQMYTQYLNTVCRERTREEV